MVPILDHGGFWEKRVANSGAVLGKEGKSFIFYFLSLSLNFIHEAKSKHEDRVWWLLVSQTLPKVPFFPQIRSLEHEKFFSLSRLYSNTMSLGLFFFFLISAITENNNLSVENKEQAGSGIWREAKDRLSQIRFCPGLTLSCLAFWSGLLLLFLCHMGKCSGSHLHSLNWGYVAWLICLSTWQWWMRNCVLSVLRSDAIEIPGNIPQSFFKHCIFFLKLTGMKIIVGKGHQGSYSCLILQTRKLRTLWKQPWTQGSRKTTKSLPI